MQILNKDIAKKVPKKLVNFWKKNRCLSKMAQLKVTLPKKFPRNWTSFGSKK